MSLKIVYLIMFLDTVGMALVLPLVNSHVRALGGSLSLAGIVNSLSAGAKLFASPVIGSWSDTRGRKLILLCTLATIFLSNILTGFSSLPMFFIARFLYGAAHQTDPLVKAIIADRVPKEQLTGAFSKLTTVAVSAFILAPIVGGFLYEKFNNFLYITIILCVLDVITISILLFYVEESTKAKKEDEKQSNTQGNTFWQSFCVDLTKVFTNLKNVDWSGYGNLLAIKFFAEASFSLFFMNLGLVLMEKFSFTRTQLGFSITYMSLLLIASNFFTVLIAKKLYKTDSSGFQRILHGFSLQAVIFCTIPFANSAVLYHLLAAPLFVAKMLVDTTWMAILSSKTTEKDKGVMMGAADSMRSLSGLICPLIGGFTGDFIGVSAVILLPMLPSIYGTFLVKRVKQQDTITVDKND